MRIQLATLLALLGVSYALQSSGSSRMQKLVQGLSQQTTTTTSSTTHSCDYAIKQWKKGPADYKTILSSGQTGWTDPDFKTDNSSLWWDDKTTGEMSRSTKYNWKSLKALYSDSSYTLKGSSDSLNDIAQGAVGNCYYLAGVAAVAEDDARFDYNLVTKNITAADLYAFNVWVRGVPSIITIDGQVPAYGSKNNLAFAKVGTDRSLWGPLFEKLWSKANGNYEVTNGGYPSEAFAFLTNVPSSSYQVSKLNQDSFWNLANTADVKNYMMNIWTGGGADTTICAYNLPCGHAYSLLKAVEATLANGSKIKLYQIRNPWRKESQSNGGYRFNGAYNDLATVWSTDAGLVKQLNWTNADDGVVWMTGAEVVAAFVWFQIGAYENSYKFSWYNREGATSGVVQSYTITNPVAQKAFIKVDLYNPRMYGPNCKTTISKATLKLYSGSTLLYSGTQQDYWTAGHLNITTGTGLAAGTYRLDVTPTFFAGDVNDYTVTVYSASKMTIADKNTGKTNETGTHDSTLSVADASGSTTITTNTTNTTVVVPGKYAFTGVVAKDLVPSRTSIDMTYVGDQWWYYSYNKTEYVPATGQLEMVYYLGSNATGYEFDLSFEVYTTAKIHDFSYIGGSGPCTFTEEFGYYQMYHCPCYLAPSKGQTECGLALNDPEFILEYFNLNAYYYTG